MITVFVASASVRANCISPLRPSTWSGSAISNANDGSYAIRFGNVAASTTDALKALAPEELAGLKRRSLEVQSIAIPFKAVELKARYGDGNLTLSILNSPTIAAFMGGAGVIGTQYDRQTDDGYERLRKVDGATVKEEWRNSTQEGTYGRMSGNAFFIEVEGRGISMDDLKKVVGQIKDADLEKLPVQKTSTE